MAQEEALHDGKMNFLHEIIDKIMWSSKKKEENIFMWYGNHCLHPWILIKLFHFPCRIYNTWLHYIEEKI